MFEIPNVCSLCLVVGNCKTPQKVWTTPKNQTTIDYDINKHVWPELL